MASSAATPLPSLEECTAILSSCLDSSSNGGGGGGGVSSNGEEDAKSLASWRKLIQQCLSHGTDYDRLMMHTTGEPQDGGEDDAKKELIERAEEVGKLLADALEWYLTRWHANQNKNNGEPSTTMDTEADAKHRSLDDNSVVCAVVEAIWLVGCLLESSEDEAAPPAADGKKDDAQELMANQKKHSQQCLVSIIRHLVTPKPWMGGNDNDATQTESKKDEKEDAMEVDGEKKDDDVAASNSKNLQPLIPITALQTTLELSLLEAANLLPHPPPAAKKVVKKAIASKGGPAAKAGAAKGAAGRAPPEPDTPQTFLMKKLKKMNTDMYYRQHKFNLLAEESEGYAKLLGFLVLGLKKNDNEQGINGNEEVGGQVGHNKYIRELIGAFDLDPNRVLDLALDVLEWELNDLVATSTKEAVGSKSSFAELSKMGGNDSGDGWWGLEKLRLAMEVDEKDGVAIRSLVGIIRELDGGGGNGSVGGNGASYQGRAVAHLLGFKYRSYHGRAVAAKAAAAAAAGSDGKVASTSAAGNTTTASYPRSLHLCAAFLCAHGILDPHALVPHLVAPASSAVAKKSDATTAATPLMQVYKTYCGDTINRLKKLGVVSLNASKDKKDDKTKNDETKSSAGGESFLNDPVIGIFRALLALVDDWDVPVAFLAHAALGSEFVSLVNSCNDDDGDDDDENDAAVTKLRSAMDSTVLAACTLSDGVASDVCAWANSAINDVYQELYPGSNGNNAKGKHGGDKRQTASPSPLLPSSSSSGTSLTKDSTLADMSSLLRSPLSVLVKSGRIRYHQNLYVKLCRLYKYKVKALLPSTSSSSSGNGEDAVSEIDPSSIDDDTRSVLSSFLVPSLSLFPSDTALPAELWSVLRHLPYTIRYELYSAWRHPGLEKGTLRSMLPKDVREGSIPKPLAIIESEIETGIAARYVLKRISKENIKDMGRQLAKTSHNNPLVVFTDILGKIESYDNLILMMVDTFQFVTELSLDIMGYCLLVSLGGGTSAGDKAGRRSGMKMGGLNTEQWLASLETFSGAFYKKFPNVELRGILVYLTKRFQEGRASELGVLRSLIKTAGGYGFVDYDSTASLSDLQLDGRCGSRLLKRETSSFGVVDDINRTASRRLRSVLQGDDLGVIMLILLSQMCSNVLYKKPSDTTIEHVKVIGNQYDDCEAVMCLLLEYLSDSSMDSDAKEKFAASMPSLGELHEKFGVDTAVAWMLCRPLVRKSMFYMDDSKIASKEQPPAYLKPFTTSSPEISSSYQNLLPKAAWEHITPVMFENFYSLAIYDISCPEERYNVDIDRLKKDAERLTQLQKGGEAARGQMAQLAQQAAAAGGSYDQVRQATAFTRTHLAELDRLKRNVEQLSKDFQRQQKRCKLVLDKLEGQKESLIQKPDKEESINSSMFATSFMTFCIYPRFLLSPEDALFCAHFVKLLHKIKVPGFLTIELIDNIVNAVTGSLYCMTEDEAGNCSIFLNEIWKSVNSWRYDNDAFASELKGTPGSQLSKEFAEEHSIEEHSLASGITHDDYKAIYSQWHHKLGSAAIGCLKSTEYMHTRAALIVLSRVVLVFPTQPKTGEKILKTLGPLQSDENTRPDIRATAQGYCSQLTKARDEGMWKEENIAVTKARQEREKMKAEERKKKLAQQHEDMKKESEAISRELGDRGGRDGGWRPDRRDDRGRPWGMDPRMHSRGPPLNAGAPTFTPKSAGESRELHGRPGEARRPGIERDVWERDRGGRPTEGRDGRGRQGVNESSRGSGERRKRSRSPEPGEDTERSSTQKRSRSDRDWVPPHRSSADQQQSSRGGVGGARRSDRRGGGSSRY